MAGGGGLQRICLIAPTTPEGRIHQLAAGAQGFIYYISREGVTGAQTTLATNIASQVQVIKASATAAPVCVGFGISTPEQAREVLPDPVSLALAAMLREVARRRAEARARLRTVKEAA